jgi:D-alanyl-D-alanine carboxypeptidase
MSVHRGLAVAGLATALVTTGAGVAAASTDIPEPSPTAGTPASAPPPATSPTTNPTTNAATTTDTTIDSWRQRDVGPGDEDRADVVVVRPALGRTAQVQQLVDGAWVTRSTIRLDDGPVDYRSVRLPGQWALERVTWWRLHVPASGGASAATTAPKRVEVRWTPSDDPASPHVLVNKHHPLRPPDWVPTGLVRPAVDTLGVHDTLLPEAGAALERLAAAAHAATGQRLVLASGYRPHDYQHELHGRYAREHGDATADTFSARPGHSEHQTGLAADVTQAGVPFTEFGTTPLAGWVHKHAWEHGFVVRYPAGSEDVTGYGAEAWHLRYVGPELAAYMHHAGVATLEEAFGTGPAPTYPAN